jgi:uroporphyrinogen-III decarboxylase
MSAKVTERKEMKRMTGRERFLTALENGKPDRLPCQVHSWMQYYLDHYLDGKDQYAAYDFVGMDPVIYMNPTYEYAPSEIANWQIEHKELGIINNAHTWVDIIRTPDGELFDKRAKNEFTQWRTEHLIKTEKDFDLWNKYVPLPIKVDWAGVIEAKKQIGDKGIIRGCFFDFGQGSPWQSLDTMMGTEPLIMASFDKPQWLEHALKSISDKKMRVIELAGKFELDLVETGGGAASSTVISPEMHRRFCLPYDIIQHQAMHEAGAKVVYHLCGGLMPLLATVVENGADALETMTPVEMGGDCDLVEATRKVGDKLCFIGGFDQNKGFEKGNPDIVKEMVYELFESCPMGGYICSPSDHFFFGNPENIRIFAETCKECVY